MRTFLLILLHIVAVAALGQELDHVDHNYGKIREWNNPVAQFIYTNTSSHEQLFLPIAYQQHIRVRIEKEKLQPGESTFIYVLYYTEEFGRFDETVNVFVNTQIQPITMRVRGRIVSLHQDAFTLCPRIDESTASQRIEFEHKLIVIDDESSATITDYDLSWNSRSKQTAVFVKTEVYRFKHIQADLYALAVDKEGYELHEELVYVNRHKSTTVVRLIRSENYEELQEEQEVDEEVEGREIDEVEVVQDTPELPVTEVVVVQVEEAVVKDTTLISEEGGLNPELLKPNHIIFVIDVSSSMNKPKKLPLLKYSMSELIKVLRPQDKVTIMTYSNAVHVLAKGVSGAEKDQLIALILSLEAQGQSYGSEALEMAYDVAVDLFIEAGNNEIILASDGLFNSINFKRSREYRRAWWHQRFNDIRISSIAFGKSPYALDFMAQLARTGKGSFLQIPDEHVAQTRLIENLINHSKK